MILEAVGDFAYPHAPVSECHGDRLGVKLLAGGDGEASLGTLSVPLKSGAAIFDLSRLSHGIHSLCFRTGGRVIDADPVRVFSGGAELCVDRETNAICARIELARQRQTLRTLTDTVKRLEEAVFRTTIF
jgi:hypothetical protein